MFYLVYFSAEFRLFFFGRNVCQNFDWLTHGQVRLKARQFVEHSQITKDAFIPIKIFPSGILTKFQTFSVLCWPSSETPLTSYLGRCFLLPGLYILKSLQLWKGCFFLFSCPSILVHLHDAASLTPYENKHHF